ncbi:MAG TPA: zf-HC2 domain-containing protein [Pyrinomonadaceae bacterium]
MNCEWTEKISLLIDGELGRDEAGETELHLRACVICRQAREDFLHLRAQISAYRAELDPRTQRAALAGILAAGASEKMRSPRGGGGIVPQARRAAPFSGRFAGLFGGRANAPAWAAACVLLVACALFALIFMRDAHPPAHTIADSTPAHSPAAASSATNTMTEREPRAANSQAETGATAEAQIVRPRRAAPTPKTRVRFETASASATKRAARGAPTDAERAAASSSVELPTRELDAETVLAGAGAAREFRIDGATGTTRHVEQAQLLLRSFRNVRLTGARTAADLAEEKRRSQKLLYRNIVLRREAATKGDLPVERVLSSLEPILIDIANLPERPEGNEVLAIRERMQRKNIVAMLQVSAAGDR